MSSWNKYILLSVAVALFHESAVVRSEGAFPIFLRNEEGLMEIEIPSDSTAETLYAKLLAMDIIKQTERISLQGRVVKRCSTPIADMGFSSEVSFEIVSAPARTALFVDEMFAGSLENIEQLPQSAQSVLSSCHNSLSEQTFCRYLCSPIRYCDLFLRNFVRCPRGEIDELILVPSSQDAVGHSGSVKLEPMPLSIETVSVALNDQLTSVDVDGLQWHQRLKSIIIQKNRRLTHINEAALRGTSVQTLNLWGNGITDIGWEEFEGTHVRTIVVGDNPMTVNISRIRKTSPLKVLIVDTTQIMGDRSQWEKEALASSLNIISTIRFGEDDTFGECTIWSRPFLGGAARMAAETACKRRGGTRRTPDTYRFRNA